jgi:TPR repeat protein
MAIPVLSRLGAALTLAVLLVPVGAFADRTASSGVLITPEALQQYLAERQEIEAALAVYEAGRLMEAEKRFRTLARNGSAVGRYNLAMMHVLDEAEKPDKRAALRLLEQSAAQGFVRSEYALGQVYELGVVARPDQRRAVQWYQRAARNGHPDAQLALATAYYLGRGTPQNLPQAAHWYRLAAQSGDIGAQYLLASMYEAGYGVEQDLRIARYWYDVAAQNGDEAAPHKVKELDERLAVPAPDEAGTTPGGSDKPLQDDLDHRVR